MLLLLLLAMLPLAVLALAQATGRLQSNSEALAARLQEAVFLTANAEQNILENAGEILWLLAGGSASLDADPGSCSAALAVVDSRLSRYDNLARFDADGRRTCAADQDRVPATIPADAPWWLHLQQTRTLTIVEAGDWRGHPGGNGIWVLQPMFDGDTFEGAVAASIEYRWLAETLRQRYGRSEAVILLLDLSGRPIVTSRTVEWEQLEVSGTPGAVKAVRDSEGRGWSYTTAPITFSDQDTIFFHIAYMDPHSQFWDRDQWFLMAYAMLPVLALVFASAAILIGTELGILRWIRSLRKLTAHYAAGHYRTRDYSFAAAPRELRGLAASLYRMARTIDQRDQFLQESLLRQKMLARELNHRVKNNLQVVLSMLTMQSRNVPAPEARLALDEARLRVGALALVYRLLYKDDELAQVSSQQLLGGLCELMTQHHLLSDGQLECDLIDVLLDIDQAAAVALWTVEALTALLHYIADFDSGTVVIRLRADGPRLHLEVSSDVRDPLRVPDSILQRLLAGFARQLGGGSNVKVEGNGMVMTVEFLLSRTVSEAGATALMELSGK